jgi:hypothetical protein
MQLEKANNGKWFLLWGRGNIHINRNGRHLAGG